MGDLNLRTHHPISVSHSSFFTRVAPVWLVLVIGLIITLVAVEQQRSTNRAVAQAELDAITARFASDLHDRLQKYEYGLRGARGIFAAAGPDAVTRNEFLRYSQSRDVDVEFPGARGIGFIRRVPALETDAYLRSRRQFGLEDFRIKELWANNSDRFVIEFIEPLARNREAVGLDIASDKSRRVAAVEAAIANRVTITEPITIVQASGATNRAFLVLLPVYRSGEYVAATRESLADVAGWTYAPLVLDEVIRGLVDASAPVSWSISDFADSGHRNTVLSFDTVLSEGEPIKSTRTLEAFNRLWEVSATSSPQFLADSERVNPTSVGVLGGGGTVLAAMFVFMWIAARQRRAETLGIQERLATVIQNTRQAVVCTNSDDTIFLWNRAAESLFGIQAGKAIGQSFREILATNQVRLSGQYADTMQQIESVLTRPGQTPKVLLVTSSPIVAAKHEQLGVATFMLDVSDVRQAEQAAAKDTEDFAYTVAHDLRTPLRSVNGFATMLLESDGERLTEAGREALTRIVSASRRMGLMLTDLIDYLHVIKHAVNKQTTPMMSVVREAMVRSGFEGARGTLVADPLPDAFADHELLVILLVQLLDNAKKYHRPDHGVVIHIGFDETQRAYFVRDEGIGFDQNIAGKLFGLFQRLEAHPDIPGLGIGLAIARRIVEKHGGLIWADSQRGRGTTFFFRIPSA